MHADAALTECADVGVDEVTGSVFPTACAPALVEVARRVGSGAMNPALPESAPRTDDLSGRPRVAVVFGGSSSEHAISCLTAGSVLAALDADRYDVVAIGITRSGRWVVVPEDLHDRLRIVDGTLPEISEDLLDAIWLRTTTGTDLAVRTEPASAVEPVDSTDLVPMPQSSALARLGSLDVAFARPGAGAKSGLRRR